MNRRYQIIWSHSSQTWKAVVEFIRAHAKSKNPSNFSPSRTTNYITTALLITCMGLSGSPARATTITWTGAASNSWNDANSWDNFSVPSDGDYVINNGDSVVIGSYTIDSGASNGQPESISLSNGSSLTQGAGTNVFGLNGGSLSLDGTGTSLFVQKLFTGPSGDNLVTLTDGAKFTSLNTAVLGRRTDTTTTFIIDNATYESKGELYVGGDISGDITKVSGNAIITLKNAGVLITANSGTETVYIANQADSTGTLNIGAAQGDTAVSAGTLNASTVAFGIGTGKLVFNHTDTAYEFSPAVTGAGEIALYGGTTRFTGDLTGYTGTMSVDGGTLSVVSGTTLTLGGNYTQTANGTLKLGASSNADFGKLSVTGTATFSANADIDVDVAGINTLAVGETLSSVVSAGTLSASTFNLTDNSTLFDFKAVINGNNVDLKIVKIANIIDSINAMGFTYASGAAQVLDDLASGSNTGDMATVVTELGNLEGDQAISQAVVDTLPLLVSSTSQISTNILRTTNQVIQAKLQNPNGLNDIISDKYLWFKPVGSWIKQDERNGIPGYDANSYGFIGGLDSDISHNTKLGLAVSYIKTAVDGQGDLSGNHADINAYQAIVYGSHTPENMPSVELNWQADIGINKTAGERAITFMNRIAKSDADSYTAHLGLGAGHSFQLNNDTTIVPNIRVDYTYIRDESYTETGANALNLNVDSNNSEALIIMAKGNLSHELNNQATLIANAGLGYDLINDKTSLTASYVGGGTAFTTEGLSPSPWLAKVGVGINYNISDTTAVMAHYDLEGRDDFLSQTASLRFRWVF